MTEWTKDTIKEKLATNPKWIEKAIVTIFRFQTPSEAANGESKIYNGVGFSSYDAPILTSFAEWLTAGLHLSSKQIRIAGKIMPKYWKQIKNVIEAKNKPSTLFG